MDQRLKSVFYFTEDENKQAKDPAKNCKKGKSVLYYAFGNRKT